MAFHDEEKNFIKNQIQKLKASKAYKGEYISNDVLAEKAGCSVNASASWSAGRKVMSQKYRKRLTEVFSLDPHYFDLEYSEEFIQKQKSAEELNYFLSSQAGAAIVQGMTISEDGLRNLNATYLFLQSLGFAKVVERLVSTGDAAIIANVIEKWNNVFYNFYETLEPMLEEYCADTQSVMDSYRPNVKTTSGRTIKGLLTLSNKDSEEMNSKIADIGKSYSFQMSGTFDEMQNVHLDLYKLFPAPKEQGIEE